VLCSSFSGTLPEKSCFSYQQPPVDKGIVTCFIKRHVSTLFQLPAAASRQRSCHRTMSYRKKLIEVALPLDAINTASAREKSIRHGHPSTLHLWWSRKPLATCRAVLFASLVDDPSEHPELFPTEKEQEAERERLFHLIEDLVQWQNSNDEKILGQARAERSSHQLAVILLQSPIPSLAVAPFPWKHNAWDWKLLAL
jgi:hypothetical protein